jgi:hypothetical protein
MYYSIACKCGRHIQVEGTQSGTRVHCECGCPVDVPSLRNLKKNAIAAATTPVREDDNGRLPSQDRLRGCSFLFYGIFCGILALTLIALGMNNRIPLWGQLLLSTFGFLLLGFCPTLIAYGKRNLSPTVDEKLGRDKRPPVLLLRSFCADGTKVEMSWWFRHRLTRRIEGTELSFEEVLERSLRRFGPVIAIGQPGDPLPPLGAAREYVKNEYWQDHVKRYCDACNFFVLLIGSTPGVTWEVQRLAENGLLPRTLLVLGPLAGHDAWTALVGALGAFPDLKIPASPPHKSLFATIDVAGVCSFECGRNRTARAYEKALARAMVRVTTR